MYSQCDSDHAGDLLVSTERESAQLSACRLVEVAAGDWMAKVDLVLHQTGKSSGHDVESEEMLAVACGRCRGRPVASCDQ